MKIQKIKSRSFLFTDTIPNEWNLNIQLIRGSKYNYIIDTGLGSDSVKLIKDYLKDSNKPVVIINTHYHWDHIWGNSSFKDSIIISHKLCREIINTEWETMISENKDYIKGEVEKHIPNLVFQDELYFPEDKVRIIYTPGHTIDCISVLDEVDKVLNVGDNIGDTPEIIIPEIEYKKEKYIETLLKYKNMDFDICISGHNIPSDKSVIYKILDLISDK